MEVPADSCKAGTMGVVFLLLLVPDRVSVLFPDQELDPVGGLVTKNEDVSRERIAPQPIPHQGGQAVERLSKIGRLGREPDADRRRQAQHDRPPSSSSSTTRTRVWGSNPTPTRTHRPLARTISTLPAGGSSLSATTCTGRNA